MLTRLLALLTCTTLFACAAAPAENEEKTESDLVAPDPLRPDITWMGSAYATVWQEPKPEMDGRVSLRGVYLSDDGRELSSRFTIVDDIDGTFNKRVRVGQCGSKTVVVFKNRLGVYMTDFSENGAPPRVVAPIGDNPEIVSDGAWSCLVTYHSNDGTTGAVYERGQILQRVSFPDTKNAKIAYDGSHYVAAWVSEDHDALSVAHVQKNGTIDRTTTQVPAEVVAIAASSAGTYVTWYAGHELRGSFVDPEGHLVQPGGQFLAPTNTFGDTEQQLAIAAHPDGSFTIATSRLLDTTSLASLHVDADGTVGPLRTFAGPQGARISLAAHADRALLVLDRLFMMALDATATRD